MTERRVRPMLGQGKEPVLLRIFRRRIGELLHFARLPKEARASHHADISSELPSDQDHDACVDACISWLCRAQDRSTTADGGVARHFSLVSGWGPSYPETTGYIVPTFLTLSEERGDPELGERARRMLDWLVGIQFPEGGFQGGTIRAEPVVPVTFNTGQILLGLAAAHDLDDRYADAMHAAARWLVDTQDPDGCWRRYPTPFATVGEKAYETHVAWGLFAAGRASGREEYTAAAARNVRWALTKQHTNGWVSDCCLSDPLQPLTHTLGYLLRGVLEGYEHTGERDFLNAARRTAEGLLQPLEGDGFLPGRLRADWRPTVDWVCLTGSVQIAYCWLRLYEITGYESFRDAALRANRFVRRTIDLDGPEDTRGGVKGSFPISGGYGAFEYLNWAPKFFIDSHLAERRIGTA